ncbi:4'-phosphopantetheinyl transferase superfamily protein [Leifsonia sp. YIM 134122]|uniref:4'-phosphopantetheinyl transferase superfamily protein n=1 Tax=Leifsonia stereocauli TaxID=3134136 RepID=A0ABU9W1S6_9MICO
MSSAIVRWETSTPSQERRHRILELLSAPERARWEAATTEQGGDRFLVGRMLLRELSAELLGLPLEAITVQAECPSCGGPHGIPRISVHGAAAPHAGLSHTTDLVVAVILPATAGSAVGIDVETVAGSRERLTAIDELVPVQPGSRRVSTARATLRRWTRVEAVLKADGRGLLVDPRAVTVQRAAGRLTASVAGSETGYTVLDRSIGMGLRRRAVVSVAIADPLSGRRPQAEPEARARTATP